MPEIYEAPASAQKKQPKDYSEIMRDNPPTKAILASFMVAPTVVHMNMLQENEKILLVIRHHFITNLRWIILVIIMALAPVIAAFLPLDFLPGRFIAATTILWYLFVLGVIVNNFLGWFYNASVITDERIIDIDYRNLVYKNVSVAKLDNIEDVTVQMSGTIRNMFDFGTVRIQTAAEKTEFEFDDIPHPQKIAKLLNELMLEEEQEQLDGRAS